MNSYRILHDILLFCDIGIPSGRIDGQMGARCSERDIGNPSKIA